MESLRKMARSRSTVDRKALLAELALLLLLLLARWNA